MCFKVNQDVHIYVTLAFIWWFDTDHYGSCKSVLGRCVEEALGLTLNWKFCKFRKNVMCIFRS